MLDALLTESIAAGEGLLAAAAINPQHYEIVQAGYRHPYLRQETISQPILHRMSEYAHAWSENYLFPLTSLIGPSMIGKTRLLQQLSKSICVVYICLRPHGSTGQPPRSKLADQLFLVQKRAPQLELQYTLLLAAIFDVVADFFSLQSAQTSEEERLLRWYEFNDESEMFASRVVQKLAELSSTPDKAPAQLSTNLQKLHNSTCFIKNPHLKVLLAIDEARALVELQTCDALKLSYSRILRRVLATIPSSRGFFAIFTDTTSTVADTNSTLHNDNDPSGRPEPGSRPKKVFEPIYDIGTFDSKVPPGRPKTWADLLSPERLFSYGLPFFRIYVEEAKKSGLLPESNSTAGARPRCDGLCPKGRPSEKKNHWLDTMLNGDRIGIYTLQALQKCTRSVHWMFLCGPHNGLRHQLYFAGGCDSNMPRATVAFG
ncbi:hypothetical protein PSHT_16117 [Puccinia striiformis]|uniref:Uncharacterized protein n=1 Tax=Puccinia striiformis TaxID=27350 RepID=A0A2S4UBE0_9BASI|nr:hypothetical protein PSHT_16117 [Puccinia striiformis]